MVAGGVERDVRERFRRSGYTLTSQRRAVLDVLEGFEGHPSAEEVYLTVKKKNPKVALGTVYQALSVFEEVGLIEAKRWSETPVRYDLNLVPHHDIRCVRCGRVEEVPGLPFEDFAARVSEGTTYEVTSAALVIEGVCPACQEDRPD